MLVASAMYHGALVFVVVVGKAVLGTVVSATEGCTIVLCPGGASHGFVQPVQSRTVMVVLAYLQKAAVSFLPTDHSFLIEKIHAAFVVCQHKLFGIKYFQGIGEFAEAYVGIECHGSLAAIVTLAAFGGNQDYTIGTPRTIDGSGRSVFQYVDALDVSGIKA